MAGSRILAASAMLKVTNEDRVDRMAGVGRHLPISLFAFATAGVSLMGLPPSGGSANGCCSPPPCPRTVVVGRRSGLGGFTSAAYIFRVLRRCFLPPKAHAVFHPIPLIMPLAALSLASIALALGLGAVYPLHLLQTGMPLLLGASAPSTVIP